MNKYQPVIGLEVHVELKTQSKMFCRCSADYFGKEPNTHTCPVCLGLPGALPVPNKKAIDWCIMIALAVNCKLNTLSKFDRKNYFYPDLPKGYQISQYDLPFGKEGWIDVFSPVILGNRQLAVTPESKRDAGSSTSMTKKRIRIRRVHMEEDTAKLVHQFGISNVKFQMSNEENISLIDFNRSGVPLVEIVTEPDFNSPQEVTEYLHILQQIVRYLDVSNANMERGEMRLEPNISLKSVILASDKGARPESPDALRDVGSSTSMTKDALPTYKVEVKNINSFKFVEKAIRYETERQQKILNLGKLPFQETRGWNEDKAVTFSQRAKEEANDYRYFPEPDIPPITISKSQISNLKSQMVELPGVKIERFKKQYNLSDYDAEILTREKDAADYFEEAVKIGIEHNITQKQIANTIIHKKTDIISVLPAKLVQQIVAASQYATIDEKELEMIVNKIIEENKQAVEDYRNGKTNVMMFLIGQVLRNFKQKIDTKIVRQKIEEILKN